MKIKLFKQSWQLPELLLLLWRVFMPKRLEVPSKQVVKLELLWLAALRRLKPHRWRS